MKKSIIQIYLNKSEKLKRRKQNLLKSLPEKTKFKEIIQSNTTNNIPTILIKPHMKYTVTYTSSPKIIGKNPQTLVPQAIKTERKYENLDDRLRNKIKMLSKLLWNFGKIKEETKDVIRMGERLNSNERETQRFTLIRIYEYLYAEYKKEYKSRHHDSPRNSAIYLINPLNFCLTNSPELSSTNPNHSPKQENLNINRQKHKEKDKEKGRKKKYRGLPNSLGKRSSNCRNIHSDRTHYNSSDLQPTSKKHHISSLDSMNSLNSMHSNHMSRNSPHNSSSHSNGSSHREKAHLSHKRSISTNNHYSPPINNTNNSNKTSNSNRKSNLDFQIYCAHKRRLHQKKKEYYSREYPRNNRNHSNLQYNQESYVIPQIIGINTPKNKTIALNPTVNRININASLLHYLNTNLDDDEKPVFHTYDENQPLNSSPAQVELGDKIGRRIKQLHQLEESGITDAMRGLLKPPISETKLKALKPLKRSLVHSSLAKHEPKTERSKLKKSKRHIRSISVNHGAFKLNSVKDNEIEEICDLKLPPIEKKSVKMKMNERQVLNGIGAEVLKRRKDPLLETTKGWSILGSEHDSDSDAQDIMEYMKAPRISFKNKLNHTTNNAKIKHNHKGSVKKHNKIYLYRT